MSELDRRDLPRRVAGSAAVSALRASTAAAHRWWGNSWPNELADRAGRYRRFAICLAVVPVPLLVSGLALTVGPRAGLAHGLAHLAVAGCCLWLVADLVRSASVLRNGRWPHMSGVGLAASLGLMAATHSPAPELGVIECAVLLSGPAALALLVSLGVLALAERRYDPLLSVLGRGLVVAGAIVIGSAGLGQLAQASWDAPIHPIDLLATSLALLIMAFFEARVLVRALALSRLAVRR